MATKEGLGTCPELVPSTWPNSKNVLKLRLWPRSRLYYHLLKKSGVHQHIDMVKVVPNLNHSYVEVFFSEDLIWVNGRCSARSFTYSFLWNIFSREFSIDVPHVYIRGMKSWCVKSIIAYSFWFFKGLIEHDVLFFFVKRLV